MDSSCLLKNNSAFLSLSSIKGPSSLHGAPTEGSVSHSDRLLGSMSPGELIIAYIIMSSQKRFYKHLPLFHHLQFTKQNNCQCK